MNKLKKIFVVLLLVLSIFAYTDANLTAKYLSAANDEYSQKNYDEAYRYINSALKLYPANEVNDNVILFAEDVYYAYLIDIQERKAFTEFIDVKANLGLYPLLASNRVSVRVHAINELEVSELSRQADSTTDVGVREILEQQKNALVEAQTAQFENMIASQEQVFEQLNKQTDKFTDAISESVEITEKNNSTIIISISVIGALLVIVCIVFIIQVSVNNKNTKLQHERFEATLQMVSQMNRMPSERLALGGATSMYGENLRYIGSSRSSIDALPEPEQTEEEKAELADIAVKCEQLGAEISLITGRKNNARNVAELVYKLATAMGLNEATCKLYFTVSLVYDIGFLDINKELLQSKELNDEQKQEIRNHVTKGSERLDFIPEKYKSVFGEATTCHHENLDGSGYPYGLKGDEIPTIARLIRIAETFVALVSKRSYRGIMDKESAVEELRNQGAALDQFIVDTLDSLV